MIEPGWPLRRSRRLQRTRVATSSCQQSSIATSERRPRPRHAPHQITTLHAPIYDDNVLPWAPAPAPYSPPQETCEALQSDRSTSGANTILSNPFLHTRDILALPIAGDKSSSTAREGFTRERQPCKTGSRATRQRSATSDGARRRHRCSRDEEPRRASSKAPYARRWANTVIPAALSASSARQCVPSFACLRQEENNVGRDDPSDSRVLPGRTWQGPDSRTTRLRLRAVTHHTPEEGRTPFLRHNEVLFC